MKKNKILYLLRLWKDHILNNATNHLSFARYVREKYIIQCMLLVPIGQIGMVQKRNLFV